MKIFIIVLNWNNFEDTQKCIDSLISLNDTRIHIVIVDNCSSDNSATLLKNKYPHLPIIISTKNHGYAGGMNIGIKYSLVNSADYIILSNNDIEYTQNFLDPMLELIIKDTSIGIISPKVLYAFNRKKIYCAGSDLKLVRGSGVAAFQGKEAEKYGNEIREITVAEGSCFLAKKEVFEKIGFFNEEFFMYFEDVEFSDRVRKYFKIFYTPNTVIYHKGGAGTSWKNHSPLYYYYYTRNRYKYFKNYNLSIKIYVFLYSLIVSIAKGSIIVLNSLFGKSNKMKNKARLSSLLKGNLDGIKIFFY